jgi:hypothetical protein
MKKFTAVFLACLLLISTLSVVCYAVSESDFYGADDKPFFSEKYLGTVESGYPLYYFEIPSPPWMCEFSHQYGGYIITNYNGNAEKDNGFYLKNEGERIYLSEAFEKGWTDIEEVVSLTKENAPELYNYRIFSVKDAEKLVKERYNDNIKLEYVGIIYAGYYLFYENDLEKALVEWELDFEFGDYAFRAFGGHTGNVEPEALGLYVMNDGKILNIKEAYEQIPKSAFGDNYDLVNIIKSKKLNYSFTVSRKSDIKETTEPVETTVTTAPAEIPTKEPGGTTSPASSTAQPTTEVSETAFTEPASAIPSVTVEPTETTTTVPETEPNTFEPTNPAHGTTTDAITTPSETTIVRIPEKTVCPISKIPNPVKVSAKNKTVKAKKLIKKAQKIKPLTVKNAKGKLSYKLIKKGSAAKLFKKTRINSKGVITVKKCRLKKGVYKLKVALIAAENNNYKQKRITKIIKIIIK